LRSLWEKGDACLVTEMWRPAQSLCEAGDLWRCSLPVSPRTRPARAGEKITLVVVAASIITRHGGAIIFSLACELDEAIKGKSTLDPLMDMALMDAPSYPRPPSPSRRVQSPKDPEPSPAHRSNNKMRSPPDRQQLARPFHRT
jgi:hypothetical protein